MDSSSAWLQELVSYNRNVPRLHFLQKIVFFNSACNRNHICTHIYIFMIIYVYRISCWMQHYIYIYQICLYPGNVTQFSITFPCSQAPSLLMMPLPPPPEARVAQLAPPCSTFTRKSGWDSLESGKGSKWVGILDDITFSLPRTPHVFKEMEDDPFMRVWLPPKNSTSGRVLDHAKRVIESTDYRFAPMAFKIGFTHDPCFRFHNPTFGYKKDKYQQMIVLFAHHNPEVAAYLEAALIALHDGSLFGIYIYIPYIVPSILNIPCMLIYIYLYMYTSMHLQYIYIFFGFPDVTSNPFPSSRCLRKAGVPE